MRGRKGKEGGAVAAEDCAEKPHYEKPVSIKEMEESCKFIRVKGESLLGHTPV